MENWDEEVVMDYVLADTSAGGGAGGSLGDGAG